MIQLAGTLFFFLFILACQQPHSNNARSSFSQLLKEDLKLLEKTKCNYDIACLEDRGGDYIINQVCKKTRHKADKYKDYRLTDDRLCIMEGHKILSQQIEKDVRPILFECHPGEWCELPTGCTYEAALAASKIPGRSCFGPISKK